MPADSVSTIRESSTPYSYAQSNNYSFVIPKLPDVSWNVQRVILPSINTQEAGGVQTPFYDIKIVGDKITYSTLQIEFIIDDKLTSYITLHNWMTGILFEPVDNTKTYSDAFLIMNSNKSIPKIKFSLRDLFPVSISELSLDTTNPTIQYLTCTASFELTKFDIDVIPV